MLMVHHLEFQKGKERAWVVAGLLGNSDSGAKLAIASQIITTPALHV